MRDRWVKEKIQGVINNHVVDYPVPSNIQYKWGIGQLSGIILVVQIITGILLGAHYSVNYQFESIEHIMREVQGGYLIRYIHQNGASMFFIAVYLHIGRGLYYGQYKESRQVIWISGVVILLLMIITAFIGYVLPNGQMSLWGATVITNLLQVIPLIGESLVVWIWGGFTVAMPTVNRFLSFHYILPIIIVGVVLIHILLLHRVGQQNKIGVESKLDKVNFYPYCYVKDLLVLLSMIQLWFLYVGFAPNVLGHQDNYIKANPMSTPQHIVPEWYFLLFYGILRQLEHKLGGVMLMLFQIVGLILLVQNSQRVQSKTQTPIEKKLYWVFIGVGLVLVLVGGKVAEEPYISVLKVCGVMYFSYIMERSLS